MRAPSSVEEGIATVQKTGILHPAKIVLEPLYVVFAKIVAGLRLYKDKRVAVRVGYAVFVADVYDDRTTGRY